jgi:hypothetical protein
MRRPAPARQLRQELLPQLLCVRSSATAVLSSRQAQERALSRSLADMRAAGTFNGVSPSAQHALAEAVELGATSHPRAVGRDYNAHNKQEKQACAIRTLLR